MSRVELYTVCLLCSGLDNEDKRQSAPLAETLHCTSTRRASPRYVGEAGTRKPLQQKMREILDSPKARDYQPVDL